MKLFPSGRTNLAQLFWLRCLSIAGQLIAIFVAREGLGAHFPLTPMLVVIALEVAFNGLTWVRMQFTAGKLGRDTDVELMGHLLVDIGALSVLLFFSGGATNPFVSLYLPGLAIAAAVLPWRYAALLALLSLTAYGILSVAYVPLNLDYPADLMTLHLAGLWVNFVISVLLITWFVSRMSGALRTRDAQLSAAEQRLLRDERMAALGSQAASVAHELGTPLSTMAVVIGELRDEMRTNPELKPFDADLETLEQQIALCKGAISHVQARAAASVRQSVQVWLPAFVEQWRLRHPNVEFTLKLPRTLSAPVDDTVQVGQILTILLDNAATVCPSHVVLGCELSSSGLVFHVIDHGPGIHPLLRTQLGTAPVVSSHGGHGMGLYLAFASVARLGGTLALHENRPLGTRAELRLPMTPRSRPDSPDLSTDNETLPE
ncbi:sensor kinase protein [Pandoraea thiooxydans]|uniref:histidine kinase n=1 Tax=Pandoraea thiooxydans TaxID=445709 RepID=A0A0G3EVY3_9BURK|nr:ATP-binding protein [Pandoraea thiooxydans]AKJ69527.1 two-component sensor histidine kinase [Pandoraea thiooxydans]APR97209.1 sensor kinase protein [Pandoraea thiooxydans]